MPPSAYEDGEVPRTATGENPTETREPRRRALLRLPLVELRHLGRFVLRVLADFRRNNGLLVAGALGYNTLLSIVPLFASIVVVLSHFVDEATLIGAVDAQAEAIFPGRGAEFTEAFEAFLDQRELVGGVGLAAMLFFSTIAFRMLENAMENVFRRKLPHRPRHWIRSLVLHVAYIVLIAGGVLLLTLTMVAFDAFPEEGIQLAGWTLFGPEISIPLVKLLAFAGLVVLLSSFYGIIPPVRVRMRLAFVGGAVAASLWEGVRLLLMWWFANLSIVNVIYGSLAAVVVLLLSLEIAAIILLLGAEVISTIERSHEHGLPWYDAPAEE